MLAGIPAKPSAETGDYEMVVTLRVVGAFFIFMGIVWFLQGLNILLGSPMSGDSQWCYWGTLLAVVGAGLIYYAQRRRRARGNP